MHKFNVGDYAIKIDGVWKPYTMRFIFLDKTQPELINAGIVIPYPDDIDKLIGIWDGYAFLKWPTMEQII